VPDVAPIELADRPHPGLPLPPEAPANTDDGGAPPHRSRGTVLRRSGGGVLRINAVEINCGRSGLVGRTGAHAPERTATSARYQLGITLRSCLFDGAAPSKVQQAMPMAGLCGTEAARCARRAAVLGVRQTVHPETPR
jgi:hypothetical protein